MLRFAQEADKQIQKPMIEVVFMGNVCVIRGLLCVIIEAVMAVFHHVAVAPLICAKGVVAMRNGIVCEAQGIRKKKKGCYECLFQMHSLQI